MNLAGVKKKKLMSDQKKGKKKKKKKRYCPNALKLHKGWNKCYKLI